MPPPPRHHVFAYGSLVARPSDPLAVLRGYRRRWGVAMDNAEDIPGYKIYVTPEGQRPPVFVAYLDLVEATGAAVNGVLLEVDEAGLRALDARELNYVRTDVTAAVAGVPDGARVWTYLGRAASRARLERARRSGRAVVEAAYARSVLAGFAALGPGELDRFRASTEPHGLPEAELLRVDLPPDGGRS